MSGPRLSDKYTIIPPNDPDPDSQEEYAEKLQVITDERISRPMKRSIWKLIIDMMMRFHL